MAAELAELRAFQEKHRQPGIFVLPNAWDPGSAILMAEAGFSGIATTSAGIAFSQGLPDDQRICREHMLEICGRIAAAVPVPVTADLEDGYGESPEDVAATVRGALSLGLAGCNIGDGSRKVEHHQFDMSLAVERIGAAAAAARSSHRPFVLNARTDSYLVGHADAFTRFKEVVDRANAYAGAGADCFFVPGMSDATTIAQLLREIDIPLNILAARAGRENPLTVNDMERLGVRRLSIGSSLSCAALGLIQNALLEIRENKTFSFANRGIEYSRMNAIMSNSILSSSSFER